MTDNFSYGGGELEMFSQAKNWKKYFCGFIMPHIKGRVLEVGAGLGTMTAFLNKDPALEWVLLEPDIAMAGRLKQKITEDPAYSNCTVINGTITEAGIMLFDTIIYIDVLEHIADDRVEIMKAAALLNPGGKLIVLSPAFQFLFSPFDTAIGHFRRYTKKNLQEIAVVSLREVMTHYLDTVGFFSSLANKLLLKQRYPRQQQVIFWDRFLVPLSIVLDRILLYKFGKSILIIWEK